MNKHDRSTVITEVMPDTYKRPEIRLTRRGRVIVTAMAGLAIVFGVSEYKDSVDGPDCSGEQVVVVQPGDSLSKLEVENIDVTSGFVSFQGVPVHIKRTEIDSAGNVHTVNADANDPLLPSDRITMPATCEQ